MTALPLNMCDIYLASLYWSYRCVCMLEKDCSKQKNALDYSAAWSCFNMYQLPWFELSGRQDLLLDTFIYSLKSPISLFGKVHLNYLYFDSMECFTSKNYPSFLLPCGPLIKLLAKLYMYLIYADIFMHIYRWWYICVNNFIFILAVFC